MSHGSLQGLASLTDSATAGRVSIGCKCLLDLGYMFDSYVFSRVLCVTLQSTKITLDTPYISNVKLLGYFDGRAE